MKIKIRRALSFLIDYCIIDVVVLSVLGILNYDDNVMLFGSVMFITTSIYLIFRDVFGRSIGKKMMKLEIVSSEGRKASLSLRVLRNITLILYPIEIICVLVRNDEKRISDLLLGTNVVVCETGFEVTSDRSNISLKDIGLNESYTVLSKGKIELFIRRIVAILVDYFIIAVVIAILFVTLESFRLKIPMLSIVGLVAISVYFKDIIFSGASIGKRITRLVVLKNDLSGKATVKMHLVRSLFVFLYPIEFIVLLVSGQRIGDYIAKTKVVCVRKHKI